MKTYKQEKTWEFFQSTTENPYAEIVVGYKTCKNPRRTNIYKELMQELDLPNIAGFGYRSI